LRFVETQKVLFFDKETEVIFVKDLLFAVLALISLVAAVFSFLNFQRGGGTTMFVIAIICILAMLGFGAMFLAGRVNKTDEIHITE
jgi:hypothetical protein